MHSCNILLIEAESILASTLIKMVKCPVPLKSMLPDSCLTRRWIFSGTVYNVLFLRYSQLTDHMVPCPLRQ